MDSAFSYQIAMRHASVMAFSYQMWLAIAWRIGGPVGEGMTRWLARAFGAPSDPALIDSRMDYPYYIAWFKAHGSYRDFVRLDPPVPMLFVYGKRKPFHFHTPAWTDAVAARPGNAVRAFDTGHWVMSEQPRLFNAVVDAWLAA